MKTKRQKTQYGKLSDSEKRIYDSIMASFPNTSHESACDKAIEGGVNFQFICK